MNNWDSNNIGDEGAAEFEEALEYNLTLQKLDLSKNLITSNSIIKFSKGLQMNQSLQEINLG